MFLKLFGYLFGIGTAALIAVAAVAAMGTLGNTLADTFSQVESDMAG